MKRMKSEIICQKCKSILPPGISYCPHCGSRISAVDDSEPKTVALVQPAVSVYLTSGTILQEKYRINHVIGQGGFGITYDGTDLKLQMHITIKEYFPAQIADRTVSTSNQVTCTNSTVTLYEHGMRNFINEARNMAKFAGQPGFASVHDYFSENNTAYIIMEYVDGLNLKDYMRQHGPFSMDAAMTIAAPVMDALEMLHSNGVIHRDISPTNIMVLPDNRVKLLDFGAVRDISPESQTLTTMSAIYKKGYSPIEQQTTDMEQGTYSDIYALCATLYEMLTGSIPPSPFSIISGTEELIPPSSMGVQILPSQEQGLLKGLAVYPKDRIQTIAELRRALSYNVDSPASSESLRSTVPLYIFIGIAIVILIILVLRLAGIFISEKQKSATQPVVNTSDSSQDAAKNKSENPPDDKTSDENAATEDQDDETLAEQEDEQEEPAAAAATEEEQEVFYDYPEGSLSYGGHHYYIFDNTKCSWEDAMQMCRARGGYLAVINDSVENEVLYRYMTDQDHEQAFFGLICENGSWDYKEGDTSDFRDWGFNNRNEAQPNNAKDEYYNTCLDIHMHNGHWSDSKLGEQTYTTDSHRYKDIYTFICEWDG